MLYSAWLWLMWLFLFVSSSLSIKQDQYYWGNYHVIFFFFTSTARAFWFLGYYSIYTMWVVGVSFQSGNAVHKSEEICLSACLPNAALCTYYLPSNYRQQREWWTGFWNNAVCCYVYHLFIISGDGKWNALVNYFYYTLVNICMVTTANGWV